MEIKHLFFYFLLISNLFLNVSGMEEKKHGPVNGESENSALDTAMRKHLEKNDDVRTVRKIILSTQLDKDENERISKECFLLAAEKGHLSILRWLLKNVTLGYLMDEAARLVVGASDPSSDQDCDLRIEILNLLIENKANPRITDATGRLYAATELPLHAKLKSYLESLERTSRPYAGHANVWLFILSEQERVRNAVLGNNQQNGNAALYPYNSY